MTIKRKNIRPGGLLEVEADPTDTVDTNGFSDPIQVVGAKTAKFSGGGIMKANVGKRIGLTQLKINSAAGVSVRTEVAPDFVSFPSTGVTVDNNNTTFTISDDIGATGEAVIDYGSIATRNIKLVTRITYTQAEFGSSGALTFVYQISDDNITYTNPVTSNPTFQTLSTVAGGDMMGGGVIDTGIITYDDANLQSFRYVKITVTRNGTSDSARTWFIYQITEDIIVGIDQVTVRVRSSVTQDGTDGTIIINNQVMNVNETLTFDTELLLTGNGEYVTVEIVSVLNDPVPVTLSEITSILEV